MVCSSSEQFNIPAFKIEAVETTGAGDSFNAGFLHQYTRGRSLKECARFGTACGALAVTALGGTGAFQDKATVQKKLKEILEG